MTEKHQGIILYQAFAHNDEWHSHPLFDSLDMGFNAVEADVHLIDDTLYVGHEKHEVSTDPAHTLDALYLKPLANRIKENRGKVFPESTGHFLLMIDCKSDGEAMYPALKETLKPYEDLLCSVHKGEYREGALLIMLCGNRPLKSLPADDHRYMFMIAHVADLGKGLPNTVYPLINEDYRHYFKWPGKGPIPEEELQTIRDIIARTHKEGKLFRWVASPDTEEAHRLFFKEGADLISTDNLYTLFHVLRRERGHL
jgi:hypothetical protein